MPYADKYPTTLKDIPADTEFLLLYNKSIQYEDGYGGTAYDKCVTISTFNSAKSLKEYVEGELTSSYSPKKPSDFIVVPYRPIRVTQQTIISFDEI